MDQDLLDKIRVDILLKEYDNVWQTLRSLIPTIEKSIGFGLVIISAALTFGIQYNVKEILIFLPLAVFVVLFYGIDKSTETISLGGYKKYLEEQLNDISKEKYLCWESDIARKRHANICQIFLYTIYILFLILTIIISLITALTYSTLWFVGILIANLFLIAGFIISIYKMLGSFNQTYLTIKNKS